MAGLLDLFGGAPTDPGALYGGLLSPEQSQALGYRGLLGFDAGLGSSMAPGSFARGAAAGFQNMLGQQDAGAQNAMRARLLALQGMQIQSLLNARQALIPAVHGFMQAALGGGGSPGSPGAAAPAAGPQAAPTNATPGLLSPTAGAGAPSPTPASAGSGTSPVPALTRAILNNESGGNLNAPDGKSGEIGPMQILPSTAKEYGVGTAALRAPAVNLSLGGKIISDYAGRYGGDPEAVAVAYNAGPGVADKWLASGKDPSVLTPGTRQYVQKVDAQLGAQSPQMGLLPSFAGGAPAAPSTMGINPRLPLAAAGLGMLSQLSGLPDIATPFGQAYQALPAYKGAVAGAQAAGTYPYDIGKIRAQEQANIAQAGPIAAAKANYEFTPARPGTTVLQGGRAIFSNPIRTQTVDALGNEHQAFLTPPLPGQPATLTPVQGNPVMKLGAYGEKSLNVRAEEEQKQRQDVIEEANAAQGQNATLYRLRDEIPQIYTGVGAEALQNLRRYTRVLFPNNQDLANSVGSFEDFTKNVGLVVREAVRATSSRAAVQEFKLIGDSLQNPEMSPIGLRRVTNEFIGLNDYKAAKAQAQQQWEQRHGGLGNVAGFETQWQKNVSPYAFIVAKMDPADRAKLVAQLNQSKAGQGEIANLRTQLQFLKANGLDGMLQ